MKEHYEYILVGAGLFNAVLANFLMKRHGTGSGLVIEKRNHIAGNCYSERKDNIDVHTYGPHVFHCDNKRVWDFVNQFGDFNMFQLNTIANYKGKIYNLPFNMNTFHQLYGVVTPEEAQNKIKEESEQYHIENPKNLEEQAINMVGKTMYETLIKGYTLKQWQRDPKELPSEIIKRLPLRFTYDNNYFNDKYQGIPVEGYTKIIERMYKGADILLNTDFLKDKEKWESMAGHVFYSGCIDEYYD